MSVDTNKAREHRRLRGEAMTLDEKIAKLRKNWSWAKDHFCFEDDALAIIEELQGWMQSQSTANEKLVEQIDKIADQNAEQAARISELQAENEKLREFVGYVMANSFDGMDTDGGCAQDEAERLGLLEMRPISEEDSIDGETEHYFLKWSPK